MSDKQNEVLKIAEILAGFDGKRFHDLKEHHTSFNEGNCQSTYLGRATELYDNLFPQNDKEIADNMRAYWIESQSGAEIFGGDKK